MVLGKLKKKRRKKKERFLSIEESESHVGNAGGAGECRLYCVPFFVICLWFNIDVYCPDGALLSQA